MSKKRLKKLYFRFKSNVISKFPAILSYLLPRSIVIEATNQCMLKCRVCATANDLSRSKGILSMELFRHLLNQLDWHIRRINFSYAGEPLLNNDIFKMVKLANKKGIPSIIETNGMLLDKCSDELLGSSLSRLKVAFDGVSQESVEKYRKGIVFPSVIEGVKSLVIKRKKLGLNRPQIHLQFIVMKHNEKEMNKAIEIARGIGVDFIDFKSMILSGGIWLDEDEKNKYASDFLPENEEFKRYYNVHGSWVLKDTLVGFCPYPISGTVVMWNGDVTVCTMDVNGRFIMGNIKEKPLRTIWRDKKNVLLRKKVLRKELEECKECGYLSDHFSSIKLGS